MNPTTCIHYVGPRDGDLCMAGVDIHSDEAHKTRPAKHCLPCMGFVRQRFGFDLTEIPCPHFRLPTKEEIEEDEKIWRALSDRLQAIRPITDPIREQYKGRAYSGEHVCPNCGTALFIRMAPNGHMRGNCQTQGCVHWLE